MNTIKTLTREARATCAILAICILALLWGIQVDASLGDDYGALVLAGALVFVSALGAFIVTSELRDDNAKQLRARMSRLHTQQVNTLSDAIVKLETQRDNLSQRYTALVIENTATQKENKRLANYTHSASTALLVGTLDKAYSLANGETVYPLA